MKSEIMTITDNKEMVGLCFTLLFFICLSHNAFVIYLISATTGFHMRKSSRSQQLGTVNNGPVDRREHLWVVSVPSPSEDDKNM